LRVELESRNLRSKEPHLAREPQVADPWVRQSPTTVRPTGSES